MIDTEDDTRAAPAEKVAKSAPQAGAEAPSAPAAKSSRPQSPAKELIVLRNYKLSSSPPANIRFSRCMVRFQGLDPLQITPGLIWGVQGTTSVRDADGFASIDAQARSLRVYQIDMAYRTPGLPRQAGGMTEAQCKALGHLNCLRATVEVKRDLRKRMLKWLHADGDHEYTALATTDFDDLILRRPMLIHRLMAEEPEYNVVLHPVQLNGGVRLKIATVRNVPHLIESVVTRFHDEIPTSV